MFIQENRNYSNLLISILNSELQNPYKLWEKNISLDSNQLFSLIENHFINTYHIIIRQNLFNKTPLVFDKYLNKINKELFKIKYFKQKKFLLKNHINLINLMFNEVIKNGESIIIDYSIKITYHIIHILNILIEERYEKFKNNLHIIIEKKLKVYIYIEKDVINMIHKYL